MGYEFQEPIIKKVLSNFKNGNPHVCLAAAPNSGKTRMAIRISEEYKAQISDEPVMVFTHGQVLLREQWKDVFESVENKLSHHVVESGDNEDKFTKDIILSLPQTLKNHKMQCKVGLLIVDEAHEFFRGKMVQGLIARFKPTHILLLTGSPSTFLDDPKWKIIGLTVQELLANGIASDPHIELVESSYSLTLRDYMDNMTLMQRQKMFDKKETFSTLDTVLQGIITRIAKLQKPVPASWEGILEALQKTMVVCHNQSHAMQVSRYFDSLKISHALSISNLNNGTSELKQFKADPKCRLFVVVNRGVIGFDFPELHNIIDLSGTLNPNRLFQLMCRLIRKDDKNPSVPKIFIKVTNQELAHLTHFVMSFVVALSDKKYYYSFKETAFKSLNVPISRKFLKQIADANKKRHTCGKEIKIRFPSLPRVYTMNEISKISRGALKTVAFTNFKTVKHRLYSKYRSWTLNEALSEARMYATRAQFEKGSLGAYAFFRRTKQLALLNSIFPTKTKWTLELCLRAIEQCKTREELRKNFGGAHHWLFKNANSVFQSAFPKNLKQWEDDEVLLLAKQCKSRIEFKTRHQQAYGWLARHKKVHLLDAILPSQRQEIQWTEEMVLDLAKNYPSKSQFREAHHGAFKFLKRNGKLSILPFKQQKYRLWDEGSALEAALDCHSAKDFEKRYCGAAEFLRRNNLQHKIKGIFATSQPLWNDKTVVEEAKHYIKTRGPTNISKFKQARPGAYHFLQKAGKLHLLKALF